MKTTAVIPLLAALLLSACGDLTGGGFKTFDYELRGKWVSNDASVYSGTLEIDYDRITITGYAESQGVDADRPFRGFTKNVSLKGYSQDGKLFIEDRGQLQHGVPYTCWETTSLPSYQMVKFISFAFGGGMETLRCE